MKRLYPMIILLVFLVGCSTEGDIKFINRTEHPLYFSVKGDDYTLDGSTEIGSPETKSISVDTGSKFLFWGGDTKKVDIHLEGETFLMQQADNNGNPTGLYYTETTVNVEPDETTKIYCDPTHAGIKVVNLSSNTIIEISYSKNQGNYAPLNGNNEIEPGDSFWARLDASSNDYPLFYSFRIVTQDYQSYILDGGELEKDDQFEWIFID